VRENIAAFGGDPRKVTVFGQSAGGGCVASLLAMPDAAGLFCRAIVQSVPRNYVSMPLAVAIADELAAVIARKPTKSDLMDCDPHELVAAGDTITRRLAGYSDRWGQVADTPSPYAPVVDGAVLPQDPWSALAAGASSDVPLVVGHTREEYRLFIALAGLLGKITDAQTEHALRTFAPGGDADAYRAAYPRADNDALYELINSDWLFRMPSLALAKTHAAAGGGTYFYELTYPVPGMGGALGAPHGADVPLVFGNFRGGSANLTYVDPPSAETEVLGVRMRAAWTSFARTGDPGWAAFTAAERLTQIYDVDPATVPYPEEASRLLWESELFDTLDLVDGSPPVPAR
jgi:para-nitrobenzyl esterase